MNRPMRPTNQIWARCQKFRKFSKIRRCNWNRLLSNETPKIVKFHKHEIVSKFSCTNIQINFAFINIFMGLIKKLFSARFAPRTPSTEFWKHGFRKRQFKRHFRHQKRWIRGLCGLFSGLDQFLDILNMAHKLWLISNGSPVSGVGVPRFFILRFSMLKWSNE